MKRIFSTCLGLLIALAVLTTGTPALAALKDVGPIDVTNGFPVWYRDTSTNNAITIPPNPEQSFPQGLPLQLCLSQTLSPTGGGNTMCGLLAEGTFVPTDPIIFPSNFPGEAFWFAAESGFTGAGDIGDALIVIALEAAFAAEDPIPGDQVSFARVRIRVDINTPGDYRVTHPYGVETFTNVPAGVRTINFTSDIGIGNAGDFNGALSGAIGPFVTWDGPDFPVVVDDEAFIGDPNVQHTITGSPFGTNYFRIERIDAQGNTLSSQESTLFAVTGKIYTTPIASPLKATRASYVRDAGSAHIYVFAEADIVSNSPPALSTLEVNGTGFAPTTMSTDGAGNFYAHIEVDPNSLPASVTVSNIADVPANLIEVDVVDEVNITSAVHDENSGELTITATSSERLTPPVLSTPYGVLNNGTLVATGFAIPPSTIEVASSAGGTDQELVTLETPSRIVSPNGGESLVGGETYSVVWTGFPNAAYYRTLYSVDGGANWVTFGAPVVGTSVDWTVPFVTSSNVLLRVAAYDAGNVWLGRDHSDAPFSITIPQLTLIRPNGGESLTAGQIYNIQWTAHSDAAYYRTLYSADGGNWITFGAPVVGTSVNWTVPFVTSSNVLLRVAAYNAANVWLGRDHSNATFSIAP